MGAIQTSLAMQFEDADPELRASPAIVDGPSGKAIWIQKGPLDYHLRVSSC